MRLVIALGGNALLKRGEPMLCENQRENVSLACKQIAKAYEGNELVITHGNGPQVGLLALQNNAYKKVPMYPLDVIGAESVGMIGYMIQQELVNYVPKTATLATILTQTQVDPEDPAFKNPTKPVGPVYDKEEAEQLAKQHGWTITPDNDKWRRVVPSPDPKRIWGLAPLKTLVENGHIVICCCFSSVFSDNVRFRPQRSFPPKCLKRFAFLCRLRESPFPMMMRICPWATASLRAGSVRSARPPEATAWSPKPF